jgi:hypothetical protein
MTEITPELRRAVYEADCEEMGHQIDANPIMRPIPGGGIIPADSTVMPSVTCHRCKKFWIVIPISGANYLQAERQFYEMLKADGPLAKMITRLMAQRQAEDTQ